MRRQKHNRAMQDPDSMHSLVLLFADNEFIMYSIFGYIVCDILLWYD